MFNYYKFGNSSMAQIDTVAKPMQRIAYKAITLLDSKYGVDMSAVEGKRTKEKQHLNMIAIPQVSWTMNSDHIPDENDDVWALDIYPWFDGSTSMADEHFNRVAAAMFEASQRLKIGLSWGGFWGGKTKDGPHWFIPEWERLLW